MQAGVQPPPEKHGKKNPLGGTSLQQSTTKWRMIKKSDFLRGQIVTGQGGKALI